VFVEENTRRIETYVQARAQVYCPERSTSPCADASPVVKHALDPSVEHYRAHTKRYRKKVKAASARHGSEVDDETWAYVVEWSHTGNGS
jgi:hypothetical protein